MKIFNSKTVVGLFDRGKDVEKAIDQLQKQGFGQDDEKEVRIIDEQHLAQEMPVDVLGQRITAQPDTGLAAGNPAVLYDPGSQAGVEAGTVERNAQEVLTRLGIDDKEASYFAQHIARGNSIVVVETSEDRAAEALKIMQQANATALVG